MHDDHPLPQAGVVSAHRIELEEGCWLAGPLPSNFSDDPAHTETAATGAYNSGLSNDRTSCSSCSCRDPAGGPRKGRGVRGTAGGGGGGGGGGRPD